jgi:23S rRNA (uracil1939-C5)-methyltransferase
MKPDKPCPHYPHCVGCALIGQPYTLQLERKRRIVSEAVAGHPALRGLEVPEVIGSPRAFGYRNQAKLVARSSRHGLLLGIYRPGSHEVVDITQCPVHDPLITRALERVAREIERRALPIYDERTGRGLVRHVVVRVSNWARRVQIILVTRERALPDARGLARALLRLNGVQSVVQNVNPDPGNVIFGHTFVMLGGTSDLMERVGFLKLKSRAGSFLQANIPVARKVYERVLEWAAPTPEDNVVDLHCGAGAISFYLATAAARVVGIESAPLAVLDAKTNIRLNGFHNVRFHEGTAQDLLPAVARPLEHVDVVSLNPPRKGADEATREAIVDCGPRRVVYVSCDPKTLARDLSWFAARRYRTVRIQPFDMLPQTEHVECVALLERT